MTQRKYPNDNQNNNLEECQSHPHENIPKRQAQIKHDHKEEVDREERD